MNYLLLLSYFFLFFYLIYSKEQKPITGFFYIYEWDAELDDVYPKRNATLHPQSSYDHSFNENRGAGKLLVPEVGLFQTWQFSLYKNALSRLRASRYRTRSVRLPFCQQIRRKLTKFT
jgi:hypothetical protein